VRISPQSCVSARRFEPALQGSLGETPCFCLGVGHLEDHGAAIAQMVSVFSEFERKRIAERTREALAVSKASGVRLGRPPTVPQVVVRRIQRQRARGER
jgi:DNA invertase Pin-like site-specific DNA recombinase